MVEQRQRGHDVALHIARHVQIGALGGGTVDEMKHHIEGLQGRRQCARIGEIALVPFGTVRLLRKLAAPPERPDTMSSRHQPPAQICPDEAAAAQYDARRFGLALAIWRHGLHSS